MFRLHPACISCLTKSQLEKAPADTPDEIKTEYMQRVLKVIAEAPKEHAAPVVAREIGRIQKEMFGIGEDYTQIKVHFNDLMLKRETEIRGKIAEAQDPLKLALQYAMIGNYIDFGARYKVDEEYLKEFLSDASEKEFSQQMYEKLKLELASAKKLTYLTDNCGEIVVDKVLIAQLQKQYPDLEITVIVRGAPASNDATMEDAIQVGLTEIVKVIGNGSNLAGTWMEELSEEAKKEMQEADLILAKGQGNYETLRLRGMNIYYLFLCKCQLFAELFQVPKFTGMLVNEKYC